MSGGRSAATGDAFMSNVYGFGTCEGRIAGGQRRGHLVPVAALMAVCWSTAGPAVAQSPATTPFDACGVLVQGGNCVLFEGGGGRYFLSDYGTYRVGDAVRVVGTLDPGCTAFCNDFDGCISGAVVYNPAVYPCGTDIPGKADLVTGLCEAATGALTGVIVGGLWLTRKTGRKPARS